MEDNPTVLKNSGNYMIIIYRKTKRPSCSEELLVARRRRVVDWGKIGRKSLCFAIMIVVHPSGDDFGFFSSAVF